MVNSIGSQTASLDALVLRTRSEPVAPSLQAEEGAREWTGGVAYRSFATIVQDMTTPPVDATKVAALKEAVASGSYPVDAGRLADAMLALAGGTSGE